MILPINVKCNLNCIYCSAKGEKRTPSFEENIQIIKRSKLNYITLTGGETTLELSLLKYLKVLELMNKSVELQSNGINFSNKKLVDKISKFKIDLFNISLPIHISQIHDKITQTKNLLDKRVEGIRNLLNIQKQVKINCVVFKDNYKLLEEYALFIKLNFPNLHSIQFSFIKAIGAAKNKCLVPTYEEVEPFLKKAVQILKKSDIKIEIDHIPLCFLKSIEEFSIDKIKLTQNIIQDNMDEKSYVKDCNNCEFKYNCLGPRKDYINIYKEKQVKPIYNKK